MAFNTTTTITWASAADQTDNVDLDTARDAKVATMTAEGKTDGSYTVVNDVTTIRYWLDTAAAEEFGGFMSETAATYNCTIISIEYGTTP